MASDLRYSQTNLTQPVGNPVTIPGFVPCDNNTIAAGGSGAVNQLVAQSNGSGGNTSIVDPTVTAGSPVLNDLRIGGPNPNVAPTTAQAGLSNGVPAASDNAGSTAQGGGPSATSTGLFTDMSAMSRGQVGGGQLVSQTAAS